MQNPIKSSENYFENSRRCSDKLITAIINGKPLDLNDHTATLYQTTVQPCKQVFKLMGYGKQRGQRFLTTAL